MIYDFADRVCTGYTTPMRAHASSHRDQLNAVLGYAQTRGEYIGGFCVHVGDDGHSLHLGDQDSDEERGGRDSLLDGTDGVVLFLLVCPIPLLLHS